MNFRMYKCVAVTKMKFKMMCNKNLAIAPIFSIGMTLLMRFLYGSLLGPDEIPNELLAMGLNMGVMFNILMTGMFVTSAALAEEKEKHTLRTLMTSSVSSLEFFIGSIAPPLLIMMAVNLIVIPLSGIDFPLSNLPMFLLVTILASIISCILGMLVGVFAKDQMTASTYTSPLMLVFMFIPTFAPMLPAFSKISKFLFTGVVGDMVEAYAVGEAFKLSLMNIAVLGGEIVLALILFILLYKKNGYEAD